jgi:hypothetical protein
MANMHELVNNFTKAIRLRGKALYEESDEWRERAKSAHNNRVRKMFRTMEQKNEKTSGCTFELNGADKRA